MSHEQPRQGRLARLFDAADRGHVPLRTILVTAVVIVATYLAGKLMYLLRDIVLLLVAGFVAMMLNPVVARVQRRVPRRGLAVMIVALSAALIFIALATAFGVSLVNGTALTLGKGAVSVIIELFTLFVVVLLHGGPKIWNWTLGQMTPRQRAGFMSVGQAITRLLPERRIR